MRTIKIGTRQSRLACIQAELAASYIEKNCEGYQTELVTLVTTGDRILSKKLDEIGGKGLFVKELDIALMNGTTDLSIHSLKDMPMEIPDDIPIIGYSRREDARDVLVLPKGITEYDCRMPIGCSSSRRSLQLKELYPDAEVRTIRGNVLTRLEKLDRGEYGALVLAAAGLKRLGLTARISRYFSIEEMIPAAGQGILGIQGRTGENYDFLQGFFDEESRDCALCERAFIAYLNGGCSLPIGVYAETLDKERMKVYGLYYNEANGIYKKMHMTGSRQNPAELGIALAEALKRQCTGKVWLVGAGPGSGDLLTVKAKRLLGEADCIVYDRLVGLDVLGMIPSGKELINVGKAAGKHVAPQQEINQILVDEAKLGKKVVRLKGGDPFLFGRGGEEAEALLRENIPFEIVPGISSSLAVPAYNGIPVTHRDYVSSIHIITGHRKAGTDNDIPYEALVRTKGTLVFLMGVAALEENMQGLRLAGMSPDMPAAILQQGTTAQQRRVTATVDTLAQEAQKHHIQAPSIIIVGEVCRLSDQFTWYEHLPLFGEKILVTRPSERGNRLQEQLRALGAEVLSVPTIQTVPVTEEKRLHIIKTELEQLKKYQVLVFTSPYGVEQFFALLLQHGKDIRAVSHMKFSVIGQRTADALMKLGIRADYMPEQYNGISLGRLLADTLEDGTRLLLARSSIGAPEILQELDKNPALSYTDLAVYDTRFMTENAKILRTCMKDSKVTRVVFTSSSTVEGFHRLLGTFPFETVNAVCIGQKTARTAADLGMRTVTAKNAVIDELIAALSV